MNHDHYSSNRRHRVRYRAGVDRQRPVRVLRVPELDVLPVHEPGVEHRGRPVGLAFFVATAAWIIAAFSWVVSKAIHNSTMQQYSGIVFVWIALGMMLLGSAMAIVKFASTQALF